MDGSWPSHPIWSVGYGADGRIRRSILRHYRKDRGQIWHCQLWQYSLERYMTIHSSGSWRQMSLSVRQISTWNLIVTRLIRVIPAGMLTAGEDIDGMGRRAPAFAKASAGKAGHG